jgi:hypothetical protein
VSQDQLYNYVATTHAAAQSHLLLCPSHGWTCCNRCCCNKWCARLCVLSRHSNLTLLLLLQGIMCVLSLHTRRMHATVEGPTKPPTSHNPNSETACMQAAAARQEVCAFPTHQPHTCSSQGSQQHHNHTTCKHAVTTHACYQQGNSRAAAKRPVLCHA